MADSPGDSPSHPPTPPPPPAAGAPAPEPAKKGLSPLAWVLIVLGVILVLLTGSCVACGVIATRWMGQMAQDFEDNPTKAAAEMVVRMNPDLELVESDDEAGTITVRNVETGEEMTFDFSEVAEGRFSFSDEEGEGSLIFDEEGMTTTDSEGRVSRFGMGSVEDLPDWVIRYAGAQVQGVGSSTGAEGEVAGAFQMTTSDDPQTVVEELRQMLEDGGFEIDSTASGDTTMLNARRDSPERTLTYFVQAGESGTVITAQYQGRD